MQERRGSTLVLLEDGISSKTLSCKALLLQGSYLATRSAILYFRPIS
jgi:hypothetical protein